jgi:hypothetical protein
MNRDHDLAAIEELMRMDKMPSVAEIKTGAVDFPERL